MMKTAVLLMTMLCGLSLFAGDVPSLLVLDFYDGSKKALTADSKGVSSAVREELKKHNGVSLVTGQELLKVNGKGERIVKAYTHKQTAREMGGAVGANYVMMGRMYKNGDKVVFECKMVKVDDGLSKMFTTEIPESEGKEKILSRFQMLAVRSVKKRFKDQSQEKGKFDKFKRGLKAD